MQEFIDAQPLEVRELIYEFGYDGVSAFWGMGITNPHAIRRLILADIKRRSR